MVTNGWRALFALSLFVSSGLVDVAPTPARAETGLVCKFTSTSDPSAEGNHTGELSGGPLFADEPGAQIALRCTIQVGEATHTAPDAAIATSPTTLAFAVVAPQAVTFTAPPGTPVYLCTEATVNGQPRYYDARTGQWSNNPQTECGPPCIDFPPPYGEFCPPIGCDLWPPCWGTPVRQLG